MSQIKNEMDKMIKTKMNQVGIIGSKMYSDDFNVTPTTAYRSGNFQFIVREKTTP